MPRRISRLVINQLVVCYYRSVVECISNVGWEHFLPFLVTPSTGLRGVKLREVGWHSIPVSKLSDIFITAP